MRTKEEFQSDVKEHGYEIVDDLIKIDKGDKNVMQSILEYLIHLNDVIEKEFLVRCLGVKGYFEATDFLIKEFRGSLNNDYKWAIGNSLFLIRDKNYFNDYLEIIMEKKHGTARQMIIELLGNFEDKNAVPYLLEIRQEEEVLGQSLIALSNFRDPELIQYFEPYVNHRNTWIKNTAIRAIEKLEKLKIKEGNKRSR